MPEYEKFKNRYRIESTRLKKWDYGSDGFYFVTLCLEDREEAFGLIENEIMKLSAVGCVTEQCWKDIPQLFPFVILDEFVVMPDHLHGIIIINNPSIQNYSFNKFGPQSKNLASIIRGFKIGVTKWAKSNNIPFQWQPGYHDRIIRDENELNNVRNYIKNNPANYGKPKIKKML